MCNPPLLIWFSLFFAALNGPRDWRNKKSTGATTGVSSTCVARSWGFLSSLSWGLDRCHRQLPTTGTRNQCRIAHNRRAGRGQRSGVTKCSQKHQTGGASYSRSKHLSPRACPHCSWHQRSSIGPKPRCPCFVPQKFGQRRKYRPGNFSGGWACLCPQLFQAKEKTALPELKRSFLREIPSFAAVLHERPCMIVMPELYQHENVRTTPWVTSV